MKNKLKIQYLKEEATVKKDLMAYEFELNSKLKTHELGVNQDIESKREDRKDERVDRQANHQKEMIEQRKQGETFKKFESSGNDILTGGANMKKFGL